MLHVIADIRLDHKTEMDEKLDAAVAAAHSHASADRTCGVLVTRHDFSHFSVALSADVPFGFIHEHDHARRNECPAPATAKSPFRPTPHV